MAVEISDAYIQWDPSHVIHATVRKDNTLETYCTNMLLKSREHPVTYSNTNTMHGSAFMGLQWPTDNVVSTETT